MRMSKVLRSFRFDEQTISLIEELKEESGLENNSAFLRVVAYLNI